MAHVPEPELHVDRTTTSTASIDEIGTKLERREAASGLAYRGDHNVRDQ
jgi:hypothetical protein